MQLKAKAKADFQTIDLLFHFILSKLELHQMVEIKCMMGRFIRLEITLMFNSSTYKINFLLEFCRTKKSL